MDTATVAALLEITETSRAALRHEEPGAEAPAEARYADILEAFSGSLARLASSQCGGGECAQLGVNEPGGAADV